MNNIKTLILLPVLFFITSCGGGSGGSGDAPIRPASSIEGTAFDGLVRNATINVYAFNGTKGDKLGEGRTNSLGEYSLEITAPSQPILIEVVEGRYIEERSQYEVRLRPEIDFLYAVTPHTSGEPITLSVTHYTTLATGLAEYLTRSGVPAANAVNRANERISAWIGLDITNVVPNDITDLESARPELTDALKYGFTTAANSELTRHLELQAYPGTQAEEGVHRTFNSIRWVGIAYSDIQHDGVLNGIGSAGTLSIGSVPVTTDMYRKDTARSLLVMATDNNNQTTMKASDLRSHADSLASSDDVMFNGAPASDVFADGEGASATLALPDTLTGIVTLTPQIVIADDVPIDSAHLKIGDVEWGFADNPADVSWEINTTSMTDGEHELVITLQDAIGRQTTHSQMVQITNEDITATFFTTQRQLFKWLFIVGDHT